MRTATFDVSTTLQRPAAPVLPLPHLLVAISLPVVTVYVSFSLPMVLNTVNGAVLELSVKIVLLQPLALTHALLLQSV
jgi:hypothetical protein